MLNLPSTNPQPVASDVPCLPANDSFAYRRGRFYRIYIPQPPATNFRFVEVPLGEMDTPPNVLSIEPAKLSLAILRGDVTVLPKLASVPASSPPRPYPFEAGCEAATRRRERFWNRREVADLRRRGLLMTGEEYIRFLARCALPAPLPVEDRDN